MNVQKFKGRYARSGYSQKSLSEAMSMTVQTLVRKEETDMFTIKEIKRLQALLDLSPQEVAELFFD